MRGAVNGVQGSGRGSTAYSNFRRSLQLARLVGIRSASRIAIDSFRRPQSFWWYKVIEQRARGASALEIGGPSSIFGERGRIPIYPLLRSCDDVDYAPRTVWSENSGPHSPHDLRPAIAGERFVAEGTDLGRRGESGYELVLSSHVLEHIANPLRALKEWKQALTPGGTMVLVVPEGGRTFDHLRPTTTMEHLLSDERSNVGEGDVTHIPEVLQLHDLRMDPGAGSRETFEERCRANLTYRTVHHHVFSIESLGQLLRYADLPPLAISRVVVSNILAVCGPIRGTM
jgi:SAM-dependent methyltransferase